MVNILAIIPARGGSKGLPGKNMLPLSSRPLIWYSIYTAKHSKYISKIVVSSDDKNINSFANENQVDVIPRPAHLATDSSIITDTLLYTVGFLEDNLNYKPDIVVNLNPTSPMRTVKSLDKVLDKLLNSNYDSVFGAILAYSYTTNDYGHWKLNENHQIKPCYDHLNLKRRQDLTPEVMALENGSIYAIKRDSLFKYKTIIGNNPSFVAMSTEESIDINTIHDFKLAELFYNEIFKEHFC